MVVVEHGGNAVKTETVKMVLRLPEFQVGQQEVDDLVFVVVEALGAPGTVIALAALVEELVGSAVKFVQALPGVLAGVGMDHIQQHGDAHFVGGVDEHFQLLGLAEPGGSGKEIGDLVAEGSIVGMLHDGHDLNGVVAQRLDPGQNVDPEFFVRAHLALFLSHADVALVDEEVFLGHEALVGPLKRLFGIADHGAPAAGNRILHHPAGVQRDPLQKLAVVFHNGHDLHAVLQRICAGQEQLEYTVFQLGQPVCLPVPAAEIAGQPQVAGSRCPFPVIPAISSLVKTKILAAVGKISQCTPVGQQLFFLLFVALQAQIKIFFKVSQIFIVSQDFMFHNSDPFFRFFPNYTLPPRSLFVKAKKELVSAEIFSYTEFIHI